MERQRTVERHRMMRCRDILEREVKLRHKRMSRIECREWSSQVSKEIFSGKTTNSWVTQNDEMQRYFEIEGIEVKTRRCPE